MKKIVEDEKGKSDGKKEYYSVAILSRLMKIEWRIFKHLTEISKIG